MNVTQYNCVTLGLSFSSTDQALWGIRHSNGIRMLERFFCVQKLGRLIVMREVRESKFLTTEEKLLIQTKEKGG
jgi:hypothetical protein